MSVEKEHSALPSEYLELAEGFLETKRSELGPEVRAYPDWHPLAYNAGVAEDLIKTQPGQVSVRFFKNALFVVSVGKEVAASEDDNDFGLLQKGIAFWCQIEEERSQVASGNEVLNLLLLKCCWPAGMDANTRIIALIFPTLGTRIHVSTTEMPVQW